MLKFEYKTKIFWLNESFNLLQLKLEQLWKLANFLRIKMRFVTILYIKRKSECAMEANFNWTQCLRITRKQCLKGLSSVRFKNHSEQPAEEDEIDPASRLDSTCLIFAQNFAITDSFQSGTNHLKTAISMLRKKLFANQFGLWNKRNISTFHAWKAGFKKCNVFSNRFSLWSNL